MRSLRFALPFLLAAALVPAARAEVTAKQFAEAQSLVGKAKEALKAGSMDKAKEFYAKALERVPVLPDAHFGLGQIAMGDKRFADALDEFTKARDGLKEVQSLRQAQRLKAFADNQRQVRELRDEINNLTSGRVKVGDDVIQAKQSRLEQLEMAGKELSVADKEKDAPVPPEIPFFTGNALARLGRMDEAMTNWEECAALKPDFPPVYNNLAAGYLGQRKFDKAKAAIAKAESLGVQVNPRLKADIEAGAGK